MATGTFDRPYLGQQTSGALDFALAVLRRHAGLVITIVMAVGAAWFMAAEMLGRHAAFQSNAFDLGYFDQIAWNTSQGRWFESSFISFNFLGQHFEPVLLLFGAMYRLGAGVEALLVTQALMVSLAAVPLYFAARRLGGSDAAGVLCAGAFLLSAPLHQAVNFDFHPETMLFFFVFTSVALLAYGRPWVAVLSLLPLLLLKEDMALVLLLLAALIALRGYRRPAGVLASVAFVWLAVVGLLVMPSIRGSEESDLTNRYSYLTEGTTELTLVPVAGARAAEHLGSDTAQGLGRLVLSAGGVPLLNPLGFLAAVALASVTGLSDHGPQAQLRLHYAAPTLGLLWFGTLPALAALRRRERRLPIAATGVMAIFAVVTFVMSSPFAPGKGYDVPSEGHVAAIRQALALVPADASVEAQSALQPHLSQRRDAYEFPDSRRAEYLVLDGGLITSRQSLANGYEAEREALPSQGYVLVFDSQGVEVWRSVQP